MVLRFYQLKESELAQLYKLEDQFPEQVTVGETCNALAGEQYAELIIDIAGVVLPLLVELLKLWAEQCKEKQKPKDADEAANTIENLEMICDRPDGTSFIIRADTIPADAACKLATLAGNGDEN